MKSSMSRSDSQCPCPPTHADASSSSADARDRPAVIAASPNAVALPKTMATKPSRFSPSSKLSAHTKLRLSLTSPRLLAYREQFNNPRSTLKTSPSRYPTLRLLPNQGEFPRLPTHLTKKNTPTTSLTMFPGNRSLRRTSGRS